jgi:hypothetical protein
MPTTKPGHGSGIGKSTNLFKPGNLGHHQRDFSNPAGWVGLAGMELSKKSKGVEIKPADAMGSVETELVRKDFGEVKGSEP